MQGKLIGLLLIVISSSLWAQEKIIAEKETLSWIGLKEEGHTIDYYANREGIGTPGAPMVDKEARIIFTPGVVRKHSLLIFKNGNWYEKGIPPGVPEGEQIGGASPNSSEQGFIGAGESLMFCKILNDKANYYNFDDDRMGILKGPKLYTMPFGAILESRRDKKLFSYEITSTGHVIRDLEETREWLENLNGEFRIDGDGYIRRNGTIWSADWVLDGSPADQYVGKTKSGHNIWINGVNALFARYITISNSRNETEILLELPWGRKNKQDDVGSFRLSDIGVGPWGEIYCLIAPPYQKGTRYYTPEPGSKAELVVIRNHLKYFGRTLSDNVRIRTEPSLASNVLQELPKKTGFRILEGKGKKETIDGKTANWMNIRLLDGTEGWVFGAYVQNLYDGPNGTPPPWPNVADW